jgi:hypothetical protein
MAITLAEASANEREKRDPSIMASPKVKYFLFPTRIDEPPGKIRDGFLVQDCYKTVKLQLVPGSSPQNTSAT